MNGSEAWPELSFPDAEANWLRTAYERAQVILEYGSGESTVLAAGMSGKLIFSVESDRLWSLRLQQRIDSIDLLSPATVYHVDIGETGSWGRPVDEVSWTKFHKYPISIWDEAFFRHPDIVLIDGRFRAACMVTVLMRINRPVTVIFDDYIDRKPYHVVEDIISPSKIVGRMAIFEVVPGLIDIANFRMIFETVAQATYDKENTFYEKDAHAAIASRIAKNRLIK